MGHKFESSLIHSELTQMFICETFSLVYICLRYAGLN